MFQTGPLTLCGDNERYSPPVVMFLAGTPVLLVGVDEETSRSQFLAHYSFTSISEGETRLHMRGGTRLPDTGEDYTRRIVIRLSLPSL